MNNKTSSVCTRCGKQRIVLSFKKELVGTSMVETMETICPDPVCQAVVSQVLDEEHMRRAQSEAQKAERLSARKGLRFSKQTSVQ